METHYSIDAERTVFFILGIVGVFIGSLAYNFFSKRKTGNPLTNFQSFLFGTGFVYIGLIAWLMTTFFIDYFSGTNLQGYDATPDKNGLFFALFGIGAAGDEQYPILSIDLNFLCTVIGGTLGGAALVSALEISSKLKKNDQGIFFGYSPARTGLKQYIKNEFKTLRTDITIIEYILWWVMRIWLIYFLVRAIKNGDSALPLLFSANLAVTFVIPLMRPLFFKKLFFGRINYRVQSLINIFVFFGNFLGHGFGLYWSINDYDKILHVVSGGIVVFIGCILIEGTRHGRELPRLVKMIASAGFSCVVMVIWEIFEFFSDYYMQGSINQNWHYEPSPNILFFRVFGNKITDPKQLSVLDTNLDVFFAVVGCIICTILLGVFLTIRDKKAKRKMTNPISQN